VAFAADLCGSIDHAQILFYLDPLAYLLHLNKVKENRGGGERQRERGCSLFHVKEAVSGLKQ
ncbi:hypothetical protein Csa_004845, partial [Cucumis sativus]